MAIPAPKPRVLLAEDDAEMRWLVAHTLRRDGCEVVELATGDELYRELLDRQRTRESLGVDLIVSDVRMPGRSGLEIVELVRAAGIGVPLILMTAFGEEETRDRAFAAGAVLFDKPFHLDDLRTAARLLVLARR